MNLTKIINGLRQTYTLIEECPKNLFNGYTLARVELAIEALRVLDLRKAVNHLHSARNLIADYCKNTPQGEQVLGYIENAIESLQ